jgi:excinuclease ABC subunit B
MEKAITETCRRREIQQKYNEEHGITPKTIKKDVHQIIEITSKENTGGKKKYLTKAERQQRIKELTREMKEAARLLEFEHAAYLRDQIAELENK